MRARSVGAAIVVAVLAAGPSQPAPAQSPRARAAELSTRAAELEARGNQSAALALLWEAAGLAPRDPDVLARLGSSLERIGALEAAIDAYRRALAEGPRTGAVERNLILTLVKAGKGPEAVARAQAVVANAPNDPEAHFTLGLAQSEQDVQQAMATFRHVLTMAPRHTLARYNLALVLKRVDRLPEAVEELERALAIEPRPEAHYTLGIIRWQQGDLERAARALREAVARDPQYAEAHYSLGAVLKARGEHAAAVDALRRAIALRPDLWGARHTLAQVYQAAGNDEAARAERADAERLRAQAAREQEAGVWTSVGIARLDGGDAAGAAEAFRRAIAVSGSYAPGHYQLGRALRQLGQADAAAAAFARARQLNPSLVPPGTR
jgi:tetratricopeptide (TPR) repeat protein